MWTSKLTIIWRVSDPATVICLRWPDWMGAWPTLWKSTCCQSKHCKMGDLSITEDKQSSKSKALRWAKGLYFLVIIQFFCYKYNKFVDYLDTWYCWWRFEKFIFNIFVYSLSKIHRIQGLFRRQRMIPWKTTHRMFYVRFSSVFLLRFQSIFRYIT